MGNTKLSRHFPKTQMVIDAQHKCLLNELRSAAPALARKPGGKTLLTILAVKTLGFHPDSTSLR